jgi:hypothetical protein
MYLRHLDRPMEVSKDLINKYDNGKWITEAKLDGWLTYLVKDSLKQITNPAWGQGPNKDLFFLSRRGKKKGGPTQIPVSDYLKEGINALNLPDQTFLCAEWMCRRTIGECPESLYLHNILWYDNKWQGKIREEDRFAKVREIMQSNENTCLCIPEWTENNFTAFFERMMGIPYTEGMVLKHKDGLLSGNVDGGVDNPLIVKIKWRSGSSSREVVI